MVHVSGLRGEIRASYQRAAVLGAWTITPSSERLNTFIFRATLLEEHPVWLQSQTLDLVLALGTTEWAWRHITFTKEGSDVVVLLTVRPEVSQRANTARGSR